MKPTSFLFLILSLMFSSQAISQDAPDEEGPIFQVVEEMPRFPGCEEVEVGTDKKKCAETKMLRYIYENLKYPEAALNENIEGTVVLNFVVDKEGKTQDAKIIRDIGGGCGEEALRVLNTFPTWIPGQQRGKAVNVMINLPVRFKLAPPTKEFEAEVHEKLTPELMNSLRRPYTGLQYIFCANFSGEIVSKKELAFIAEEKIDANNICGYFFQIRNLSLAYTEGDKINKTLVSENGEFTEGMRNLLKNAQPGASFVFKFTASRDGHTEEVTKTIVVAQEEK